VVLFAKAGHELPPLWQRKRDRVLRTKPQFATNRHNTNQDLLKLLLVMQGHDFIFNIIIPGQNLGTDIEFQISSSHVLVDVLVSFEQTGNIENDYQ
jgi:hypothetical protein